MRGCNKLRYTTSRLSADPAKRAAAVYLDDLVQTPIDDPSELKKKCREARANLAARIAKYRPSAIVCLLRRIRDDVDDAALMADSEASRYVVSFPPRHPLRFQEEMKRILPKLERLP